MILRRSPTKVLVLVAVIGSLLASCGKNKSGDPTGTIPMTAVTDLVASSPTNCSVTLTWTMQGVAGRADTLMACDVRQSTTPITEENWAMATPVLGHPGPQGNGTAREFTVEGLSRNTTYHFALKRWSEAAGQWSALSNVPNAKTTARGASEEMMLVPAGTFMMGSPIDEPGRSTSETQHTVTLTHSFYLMDHEVTQGEWKAVTGASPSAFTGDDSRPVEQVSWFDAVNYCNSLSKLECLTPAYSVRGKTVRWNGQADGYRLPTEAEWEYACRAGTEGALADGAITQQDCDTKDSNLDFMGWYCANANSTTHPVRDKTANAWGLFDMHGNVWEWCWDGLGAYPGTVTDYAYPTDNAYRVVRGGAWGRAAVDCRSAARYAVYPGYRSGLLGVRPARTRF